VRAHPQDLDLEFEEGASGSRRGSIAGVCRRPRRRPMEDPAEVLSRSRRGVSRDPVEGYGEAPLRLPRTGGGARRGRLRGPRRDVVVGLVKGLWTSVKRLWQSSPTGAREHVCGFWGGWWRRVSRGLRGWRKRSCQGWSKGLCGASGEGVEVVCGASGEGGARGCRGSSRPEQGVVPGAGRGGPRGLQGGC
jgi:hypothetical protein